MKSKIFLFIFFTVLLVIRTASAYCDIDSDSCYPYQYQYPSPYSAPEYSDPEYSSPEYSSPEYSSPEYSAPEPYGYPAPHYGTPGYGTGENYPAPYDTPQAYGYPTPLIPAGGYECFSETQCAPNHPGDVVTCCSANSSGSRMCASGGGGPYCYNYEYQYPAPAYGTPADYVAPEGYGTPAAYPAPAAGQYPLTVSKGGTGTGSITSNPAGINCGDVCSFGFPDGSTVVLSAQPTGGSTFDSWSLDCSGSTCSPFMNQGKNAKATFNAPPAAFNYSLSNNASITANKSGNNVIVQKVVSKTLLAGTSEAVDIALSGVPAGVSPSFANRLCAPTCQTSINFTVAPSAPSGTFPIQVTGSPLGKTLSFNLIIQNNPITVTCSASPSPALVGNAVTWTADIVGGTPPYSYSWSGTNIPILPAPSSATYIKRYSTIGQKTTTLTVTDNTGIVSSCSLTTIQVKFNPTFEEF